MQQLAQLGQGCIRLILYQLPQASLIGWPDRRGRTSTPALGGDQACDPTLTQQLVHEPAAHAEAIGHFLTRLGTFITRRTNPLTKIQGIGLHATPPADLTLSATDVCSNLQTALALAYDSSGFSLKTRFCVCILLMVRCI
jgi:hypothetical protein